MGGLAVNNPASLYHIRPVHLATLRLLSVCRIEDNKRIDWILRSLADTASHHTASLSVD
jgi:hypothetical protein